MDTGTTTSAGVRSEIRVLKRRIHGAKAGPREEDFLAIEDPLEISVSALHGSRRVKHNLSLTMRTPGNDPDLILGNLFASGIIRSASDVEEIQFDPPEGDAPPTRASVRLSPGIKYSPAKNARLSPVLSSCGVCGSGSLARLALPRSLQITERTAFPRELIHHLPGRMRESQPTFARTGGLHAAAIFATDGKMLAVREDIGRHNALDKTVGATLSSGWIPAPGHILCVSGRMSYEILQKALVARMEVIAGVGAPSSLAVALAEDFGVTLLGFVRNGSYSIYCCPERIE